MNWLIGIAVILLGGALVTGPHWLMRVANARVTYRNIDSPQSAVYRSLHGVLVVVDHSGKWELYFIETSRREIGMPNGQTFHFFPALRTAGIPLLDLPQWEGLALTIQDL